MCAGAWASSIFHSCNDKSKARGAQGEQKKVYLQQINNQPKNSLPCPDSPEFYNTHTQSVYEIQIIHGCEREVLAGAGSQRRGQRRCPAAEQITVWCQLLSQPTKSSGSPAVHIQNNSNSRLWQASSAPACLPVTADTEQHPSSWPGHPPHR